jgi:hypothetical protein
VTIYTEDAGAREVQAVLEYKNRRLSMPKTREELGKALVLVPGPTPPVGRGADLVRITSYRRCRTALSRWGTASLVRRLSSSASRSVTRSRSTAQFSLPSRFSASQLLRQRGPALSTTLLPQTPLCSQFAENPLPVSRWRDVVTVMRNTHKPRVPIRGEVLGSKQVCAASKCYDCGRLGLQVVELFQQEFDTFGHDMRFFGQAAHQVARLQHPHPFDDVGHVGAVEGRTSEGEPDLVVLPFGLRIMEVAKRHGLLPGEIQPKHYHIAPENPEQGWVPIRIKDSEVALIRLGPSVRLRPNSPARVRAVLLLDAVEGLSVNHGFEMLAPLARPGVSHAP